MTWIRPMLSRASSIMDLSHEEDAYDHNRLWPLLLSWVMKDARPVQATGLGSREKTRPRHDGSSMSSPPAWVRGAHRSTDQGPSVRRPGCKWRRALHSS